ncbi:LysR family transcriptional regulator [Streptomyces echinatus]|uniref:LysR family transcriptional regulator n=1 Tax=Streptomyces echinatus TaxID=67293 RepID=UPI0037A18AE6
MDLALLRTFVTVHRAGSFTRAAALLGLSQPAVTSQIRTLERQLGRPLFLRQARGVTPTTIGDELAHRAAPHLDALVEIAESGPDDDSSSRTLHLAGPPEFTAERALPALTGLTGDDGQGLALRADLCAPSLDHGTIVGLLDPAVPPLRTYFLVVRSSQSGVAVSRAPRGRAVLMARSWFLRDGRGSAGRAGLRPDRLARHAPCGAGSRVDPAGCHGLGLTPVRAGCTRCVHVMALCDVSRGTSRATFLP